MLMNAADYKDTLGRVIDIVEQARARVVQKASVEMVRI